MHRDHPSVAFLGCGVLQLDDAADLAGRTEHHVPGEVGDLTRPQPRLGGQQHEHAVAKRITGAAGKHEEIIDVC
jgi:hypothetical protein